MPFFYRLCYFIGNVVFRIIFRFKVTGKHNIPKEGKVILCSNHISDLDPLILGLAIPRNIRFMAKKELFENKFLGGLVNALGAFPVDREAADLSAIRNSLNVLKNDEVLGIFPEGTRVTEENIENAKPGIALISIKAKAPVIPIYIESKYKVFSKIKINIGEPIYFNEYYGKKLKTEDYKILSQEIMKSIYSLK
ncbi:1-acyl-sn-glycerol-3-phosphate acyltransferase [Anaerosalibacter bizertensis]|uniref:1-acyl-sn-glycerol-3-phosphate acyltransferase n=1 Tax=Anaerosalibacter bizertensis TaxID=932217 RepID=A0A844FG28_9FIRM|nr:lysophospholipid acyltransferase family protein [Anaerosalibacter bizertensis]MBV1818470.1 1-acyl-sn-glycerol-3-phosphate acyltransferase [Bacteroidales bacterium MSK.15.36]MCB5559688.1 1-acyl-sn-glycerol-3-phosphate acyltransferase [Anaerosalibacter bizertensis]MCG4564279.1 1-acyl-sn-glycerol-3-phosphate acyltransferase [Anaerosalibacter bizertensis]MCG4581710.1 1-acyl-sn-glycerol-3-phosphate acyltransferase [Anaerosalibacter bizertensis]MCG4585382.1 1-acyl-sn-glycerol-3-phosphate acyltran